MKRFCGYMGWGLRVDREGNLHDTFPVPGEPFRWPKTPWRVKVRRPAKRRVRAAAQGHARRGRTRLMRACRPARAASRAARAPGLSRA